MAPDLPAYAVLCRACYAEHKRVELQGLTDEIEELHIQVEELRAENIELRAKLTEPPQVALPAPSMSTWRWVAGLAHPDRHDGSRAAHDAMVWLLSLRGRRTDSA